MAASSSSSSTTTTKKPIYFWREFETHYGYLSQWFHVSFSNPSQPDVVFTSAEQYMMYFKALLFSDAESAAKILTTKEPRKQQALGRKVKNFDNKIWEEHRERIVEEGNWWKFTCPVRGEKKKKPEEEEEDGRQDDGLRRKLLETGHAELVEASPFDRIWGVGFDAQKAGARRSQWGLNLLGKALMRVRERIRAEEQEEKKKKEKK